MGDGSAFKTQDPEVLNAWESYRDRSLKVNQRRAAFGERFGRAVMVQHIGLGHGTDVVGLQGDLDNETPGLVGDGTWRVMARMSMHVPNTRRKAGRDLEQEMKGLTSPTLDLPGMPAFSLAGGGFQMQVIAPEIFEFDGEVYARWSEDITTGSAKDGLRTQGGVVDSDIWEQVPLSVHFAAKEAHRALLDARSKDA